MKNLILLVAFTAVSCATLTTPPPEVHKLQALAPPQQGNVEGPDGSQQAAVGFVVTAESARQFFTDVAKLQEWSSDAWKKCGK